MDLNTLKLNTLERILLTLKLNTLERLLLLNTLPVQGDFTTLKIVRTLREDLSFTEEEHKHLNFVRSDEGQIKWDTAGDRLLDFTFGEKATALIRASLIQLNDDKKLTPQHLSLYEKLIGE